MNIVRRFVAVAHRHMLEWLLGLSVLLLAAQFVAPSLIRWWQLPSPGSIGIDEFEAPSLASQHLIYLPDSYNVSRAWPLVIFLHGSGERGTDLLRLRFAKPLTIRLPAIVAVPQCLPDSFWEPPDVWAFIHHVMGSHHVDPRRIYLVGYSMGGFGAVATAAAYPEEIAAMVQIAGGASSIDATNLKSVSLWAFHGANDAVVPLTESEHLVDAVRKAGGNAKLTILPNAEHGISDEVLNRDDLWQWLFAQQRTD